MQHMQHVTGTKGSPMQHEYVKYLRQIEEEARRGVDRQLRIYEEIKAKRIRAEGTGEPEDNRGAKIIIGPWVAALAGVGALGRKLFGSAHRATISTSVAAVAAGGIILTAIASDGADEPPVPSRPPAAAPPATPGPSPSKSHHARLSDAPPVQPLAPTGPSRPLAPSAPPSSKSPDGHRHGHPVTPTRPSTPGHSRGDDQGHSDRHGHGGGHTTRPSGGDHTVPPPPSDERCVISLGPLHLICHR